MNTNPSSLPSEQPQGQRAFTITELLVVIAALALLLTLTAVASTRDQTLRAQCAEHLRKIALATTLIANDNADKLPVNGPGVNWPWDMSWNVGNRLTNYMSVQTLYCPASGFTSVDNSNLWVFSFTSYHIIGYAQTFSGTGLIGPTNINITLTPQRMPTTMPPLIVMPAPPASKRVLFADSTISTGNTLPPTPSDNFTQISGGFGKPHRTCHLDGALPAGGNLAMLDGHVEWRPFPLMVPRNASATGAPFWWW
jgi:prepilin-type N-terminal cleavage/methylation domain-containing protein/prepilin-type processing-associated H-X9-DG protein